MPLFVIPYQNHIPIHLRRPEAVRFVLNHEPMIVTLLWLNIKRNELVNNVINIGINNRSFSGSRPERLPSSKLWTAGVFHMRLHDFASYIWCIWPSDTIRTASSHPCVLDLRKVSPLYFWVMSSGWDFWRLFGNRKLWFRSCSCRRLHLPGYKRRRHSITRDTCRLLLLIHITLPSITPLIFTLSAIGLCRRDHRHLSEWQIARMQQHFRIAVALVFFKSSW